MPTPITRRTRLARVAAAGVLTAAGMSPVEAAIRRSTRRPGTPVKLTIMGTTDLHGSLFNWDYFKNAEYNDSATNDIGLAKVATLVAAVRAQRGRGHEPHRLRRRGLGQPRVQLRHPASARLRRPA